MVQFRFCRRNRGKSALTIVSPETKADNLALTQWACEILGDTLETFGFDRHGEPLFQSLGFARNGELLCVVVAYQYTPPNVVMAFAANSPKWASRSNIAALGEWAFVDMKCERVTAFVRKSNKRARKFDEGMGFRYEGNMQKAAEGGEDVIVYGLSKTDHHAWLRKAFKHGKQRTSRTG